MLRLKPSPIPAVYDLLLYGGKFMMGGLPQYTELLEAMVKKAKDNIKKALPARCRSGKSQRTFLLY